MLTICPRNEAETCKRKEPPLTARMLGARARPSASVITVTVRRPLLKTTLGPSAGAIKVTTAPSSNWFFSSRTCNHGLGRTLLANDIRTAFAIHNSNVQTSVFRYWYLHNGGLTFVGRCLWGGWLLHFSWLSGSGGLLLSYARGAPGINRSEPMLQLTSPCKNVKMTHKLTPLRILFRKDDNILTSLPPPQNQPAVTNYFKKSGGQSHRTMNHTISA